MRYRCCRQTWLVPDLPLVYAGSPARDLPSAHPSRPFDGLFPPVSSCNAGTEGLGVGVEALRGVVPRIVVVEHQRATRSDESAERRERDEWPTLSLPFFWARLSIVAVVVYCPVRQTPSGGSSLSQLYNKTLWIYRTSLSAEPSFRATPFCSKLSIPLSPHFSIIALSWVLSDFRGQAGTHRSLCPKENLPR